jgi:hypothetical protein
MEKSEHVSRQHTRRLTTVLITESKLQPVEKLGMMVVALLILR